MKPDRIGWNLRLFPKECIWKQKRLKGAGMNRKGIFLTLLFLVLFSSTLAANHLGVGIILGAPTGFSFKYWTSRRSAIDFALAWDLGDDYFHIHSDYLFHFPLQFEGSGRSTFLTYLGIGGRFKFKSGGNEDDKNLLGVRGVGGIEFLPHGTPLDIFAEIAPVMNIVEETKLDIDGGIGIRFTFSL
jgi:hypothetical protein